MSTFPLLGRGLKRSTVLARQLSANLAKYMSFRRKLKAWELDEVGYDISGTKSYEKC